MIAPTGQQLKDRSQNEALLALDGTALDVVVEYAVAQFSIATWLGFSDRPMAMAGTEVPLGFEPLVTQAVQGIAEAFATDQLPENQETLADFHLLKSFNAGKYSEQRRDLDELRKARMVHPWGWVNSLLYSLMTGDRADAWLLFFDPDKVVPAFGVSYEDWGNGHNQLGGLPRSSYFGGDWDYVAGIYGDGA